MYRILTSPPPEWQTICERRGAFFHNPIWHSMLHDTFGTYTFYWWEPEEKRGFSITSFHAGPFRIGYIGFPAGGTLQGEVPLDESLTAIREIAPDGFPHIVRIPATVSPCTSMAVPRGNTTLETVINDLGSWKMERLSGSIRRNVRKALKHNVKIVHDVQHLNVSQVYRLYFRTIKRHRGTRRYTRNYFEALKSLAASWEQIRIFSAMFDGKLAGFLILGLDGDTAYYLHGATDMSLQQHRPSDLLFYTALSWTQQQGFSQFNFMSSPVDQPSLVRFKEKWGGKTYRHVTYEWPVNKIFALLFKLSMYMYNGLSRFRSLR